jgi:cytoskeletal protein CcmA (bactofilin family)
VTETGPSAVKFSYSLVVVPQREDEVANFDWDKFCSYKSPRGKGFFSVIDESTGISGKLVARNTFIRGRIDGLVFAEHVTIEKSGFVSGVIFCRTLTIFGFVRANIICDSVYVRSDGSMTATLKYKTLKFDAGANVSGNLERRFTTDTQLRNVVSSTRYTG